MIISCIVGYLPLICTTLTPLKAHMPKFMLAVFRTIAAIFSLAVTIPSHPLIVPVPFFINLKYYLFLTEGLGLHSSPTTPCSITLFGYCGVLARYPLLQS